MRPPRFGIRALMLAVVLAAFLVWGGMMGVRSFVYLRQARIYETHAQEWRATALRYRAIPARSKTVSAIWGLEIADFYAPLAEKYRRASRRPWAPVEPDPPAPVFGEEAK